MTATPNPTPPQRAQHAPSYRLPSTERHPFLYDARPEIQAYAELVSQTYGAALDGAQDLHTAIDALLAAPSEETLAHARDAWIAARRSWDQTLAFRFYDGPIDTQEEGSAGTPLDQIDGWPVDPSAIDYSEGNPTAGIVNNMKLALTRRTLLDREHAATGRAVTTGWHTIEFLLWGEEPATGDSGDRPSTDYLPGQPNNDRRRQYLKTASELLIEDLRKLGEEWEPKVSDNYAARFRLFNQRDALGRILNGIARLSGEELAIKQLATAIDNKDRRLLPSRFSVTAYQDFVFALRGVRNVWTGDFDGETNLGLEVLVTKADPALAQRIQHAIDHAEDAVGALWTPLERETLPAMPGSPARATAERAIAEMKRLASLLRDAGVKLGVAVYLPS